MVGFLEKLTLTPAHVGPDDILSLRTAGLSDQAIEDAIYVCALFNVIDRVADALGFTTPSIDSLEWAANKIVREGYR